MACRGNTDIIKTDTGIRVTSLERTVIDSIADFEKIGGLEELLRCLLLIPSLDYSKLLDALELYGRAQLYQKAGFILEAWKEELSLPEPFFVECEKRSSASKTYLFEKQGDFVLHNRWKLFAPKDLKTIINKGVTDYDAL
jgi:predicted transcriptional regulator